MQVIDREKQKEDNFQIARIVLDAGIEAAQRPIKLLVPAVAALLSLRTITLGLQIFVENEMFREQHRFSSQSTNPLTSSTLSIPHKPSPYSPNVTHKPVRLLVGIRAS